MAVDSDDMPVDWPVVYAAVELRNRGLMLSTMRKEMDAICLLLNWSSKHGIALDERIESLDFLSLSEIEGLRRAMRVDLRTARKRANGDKSKKLKDVVENGHWRNRLQACADYLYWRILDIVFRLKTADPRRVEARLVLEQIHDLVVGDIKVYENDLLEGLTEEQREILVRAITAGDPSNPFEPRHQFRNMVLWLLYIDAGLRRSEPLGIKTRHVRLGGDDPGLTVHRNADDPDETRAQPPSVKTKSHPVEFTDRLHDAMDSYIVGARRTYKNAKTSPFLFLSQQGKPLSIGAVDAMCLELRKVPGLPEDFSTHVNRRTWNDKISEAAEEQGVPPEVEKQARNLAMGWTRTSEQGVRYGRRGIRKRAAEMQAGMQERLIRGKDAR
ncbi:integrase [Bradyrhizobium sp. USDA 326]|uniref:tyrosine-type recombinase/integrase n=1 Tax=unclassified Bradyrhizobium TaxID=2631580 RepID=UPI00351814AB